MSLKSFFPGFLVLCVVAIFHSMAIDREWYFYYKYTDTIMHFLAGFVVGYMTWWFYMRFKGRDHVLPPAVLFGVMIFSTIVVGLVWEFFEYKFGISFPSYGPLYALDTIHDLIMDLLGATLAGIILIMSKAPGFKHKSLN